MKDKKVNNPKQFKSKRRPQTGKKPASRKFERHNYQDAAMEREYEKGFKSGESESKFPVARKTRYQSNDPQWYFKEEAILRDVASFSYSNPLGTSVLFKPCSSTNSIPGLMTLMLLPCTGISTDAQSGMNLGAQNIYTRVRYKNSGAANYDPPDLMLYYIAMSSLYSAWNWAKRIYGYVSQYSSVNRYKARAYAFAEHVDLDDVLDNLADFRAYLSMAADQISSFCVPAVFSLMTRQSWLFSNIYKDSETTKAQEYMYIPAAFYTYDEMSSSNGGQLKLITACARRSTNMKVSDIKLIINTMINNLQYSSDIGNMSGDTLKEFGSDLFRLSHVDPDYRVEAVYDKEVLTQIENARWLSALVTYWRVNLDLAPFVIKQDPNTNFLKFQPVFTITEADTDPTPYYINFHWNNPTPQDMMVASRLNIMWTSKSAGSNSVEYTIQDCGSEMVVGAEIIYFGTSDSVTALYTDGKDMVLRRRSLETIVWGNRSSGAATVSSMQTSAEHAARLIGLWESFDWAPQLFQTFRKDTGADLIFYQMIPLRDWDVYAYIPELNMKAVNRLALLSMFNVPN